jgi:Flp pilus assembly protein TadD
MSTTLIATGIAGALLVTAVAGVNVTMTQEQADQGVEAAHIINMTSDIQNCQTELVSEAAFNRGIYTQSSASTAVAQCEVTSGTVLSVRVHSNSRDFTITATSAAVPTYTVVSDTAAGSAVQVIEKGG